MILTERPNISSTCRQTERKKETRGEDSHFNLCTLKVKFTHLKSQKNLGMHNNLLTGSSSDSVFFHRNFPVHFTVHSLTVHSLKPQWTMITSISSLQCAKSSGETGLTVVWAKKTKQTKYCKKTWANKSDNNQKHFISGTVNETQKKQREAENWSLNSLLMKLDLHWWETWQFQWFLNDKTSQFTPQKTTKKPKRHRPKQPDGP